MKGKWLAMGHWPRFYRYAAATALCAACLSMAGCGNSGEGAADARESQSATEGAGSESADAKDSPCESRAFDVKGSDCVTLCDYGGFEVTISGDYDVTEDDAKEYFKTMFQQGGPFYTDDPGKTKVGDGDIIDADYVGTTQDGVAFDGGSADHQLIDVDNNSSADGGGYIPGFTDGLKGASVGDVIESKVTFPEDYQNEELAGEEVTFTFTVNAIEREMTLEDVDDAFAKEQFGVDTMDEAYAQIEESLRQQAKYQKQADSVKAVQDYLTSNSDVAIPDGYLDARYSDYRRELIEENCGGDEGQYADYAKENYGYSAEQMDDFLRQGMEDSIRLELVMDAIAEELGIEVDDEEYGSYVDSVVSSQGYSSKEEMYRRLGYGDAEYGERYFRDLYAYDKALEQVMENVTVREEGSADDGEQDSSEQGAASDSKDGAADDSGDGAAGGSEQA